MPSYDVAVTSLAIDASLRWTDNVVTHHDIPGVSGSRRGVARKVSHHALFTLAVVRQLHLTLGMSVGDAVRMAPLLLADPPRRVPDSGQLCVVLDRPALEREVERRLREALESAPAPRRGRPPGRTRGGTAPRPSRPV